MTGAFRYFLTVVFGMLAVGVGTSALSQSGHPEPAKPRVTIRFPPGWTISNGGTYARDPVDGGRCSLVTSRTPDFDRMSQAALDAELSRTWSASEWAGVFGSDAAGVQVVASEMTGSGPALFKVGTLRVRTNARTAARPDRFVHAKVRFVPGYLITAACEGQAEHWPSTRPLAEAAVSSLRVQSR